jgi:hypothetical protein
MLMHGWTIEHDTLLQELVHHTMPGGCNEKGPPLTWKEIGERWHSLAPLRGLGHKTFSWNKIAARYYEHIKPLYESLDQELAMNTARNTGETSSVKLVKGNVKDVVSSASGKSHEFFDALEGWEQAREGKKKAAEEGVGKETFFDLMEKMDKEIQKTQKKQ